MKSIEEKHTEIKFGKRLREFRKDRGLQQSELGRLFDLSPSTIGSYERGDRAPDYVHLIRFANYFHTSIDYLLGLTDEKMTVDEYINQEKIDLLDILTKPNLTLHGYELTDDDKRRIGDISVGMLLTKFSKPQ